MAPATREVFNRPSMSMDGVSKFNYRLLPNVPASKPAFSWLAALEFAIGVMLPSGLVRWLKRRTIARC